jgi:hypothetical protein
MTQVGELVSVAIDAPHDEDGCPFCRPKEEVNEKNTLRAAYDEDTEADNDTDNSAGTLAKNLSARPWKSGNKLPKPTEGDVAPSMDMEMGSAQTRLWRGWIYDAGLVPVLFAAHHLIPGNAAMARSNIHANGWLGPVDDGPDPMNIGYNINSRANGVWLPGNYAIRGTQHRPNQATWTDKDPEFQKAYAFLTMLNTGRQFHDAHTDYSNTVLEALNELEELLEEMENDGCPYCESGDESGDPPYHLNSRLNAMSSHLRSKVQGSPTRWKYDLLTSDTWGPQYKAFVDSKGGLSKAKKHIRKLQK